MPRKLADSNLAPAVLALDLGGTKLASALFPVRDAKPIAGRAVAIGHRTGKAVAALIVQEIQRLRAIAVCERFDVRSIGVAVPGIANPRTGSVWAPNISGWDDYPLRREIENAIATPEAKSKVNVVVDSDRAASILGEAWQGAARGCRDAVFLAVGTGIGAGILADGRVLRGAHDISGAIGWLALDRPFKSHYESCGCFEYHASGDGLAKVAKHLGKNDEITSRQLFAAYANGDAIAKKVFREAIQFWGMAAANLVSLLNPEKIIFGGGVFGPATQFLDAIAIEAQRWAQPVAMKQVTFEASQLGTQAALYGAAALAMKRARK